MQLPHDFEEYTSALMGESLYAKFKAGIEEVPPVSIRVNNFKVDTSKDNCIKDEFKPEPIPWCREGYYLSGRPAFTFDPLLHAGAYYVQEASSMFISFVLRQLVSKPVKVLDLCAAPGGKTTCAMSALPAGSIMFSNEPIRTRANILAENIMKFGHPDITVTNNYAPDYIKAGLTFDVILTDVPCSGEGMFRKDVGAIDDWSKEKVESCAKLQREIIADIWPALRPGGLLVYSTCTFNAFEDEDNIQWIVDQFHAEPIALSGIDDSWNITPALKGNLPVYRFIPGVSKGEGLFMAVLRKREDDEVLKEKNNLKALRILTHGVNPPTKKGKKEIPDISLALTINQKENTYPRADVDYSEAIKYLRRESISLADNVPRGITTVCYKGFGLGFVNNLGNRANNLYPQEWRIKSTHLAEQTDILNM